jgi:aldehyde dehydrogenase (NAD+)
VCGSFGGYKQSGVGREWGAFGFEEFLEVKSVFGADASAKAGLAELPG